MRKVLTLLFMAPAVLGAVFLATPRSSNAQTAPATLTELVGTYDGRWKRTKAGGRSGNVTFVVSLAADGTLTGRYEAWDPKGGCSPCNWDAAITTGPDDTIIATVTSTDKPRVETFTVKRENGRVIGLSGNYTYGGDPWGMSSLDKKA